MRALRKELRAPQPRAQTRTDRAPESPRFCLTACLAPARPRTFTQPRPSKPAFLSSRSARPMPRQCFAHWIAVCMAQQPKRHPIAVAQSHSSPDGPANRPPQRKQVPTPQRMGTIYGSCVAHSNRKSGPKNARSRRIKVTIYGMERAKSAEIRPGTPAFIP